ncbi:MAG TPA: site-2 protease family protein [Candidatus Hydrogenedens sp.]|nr:site-2 protease family protein [Candidatus Hydrogenedens sp.]HOK08256.1 site-2 protease family protein [Candidatus Hydrogenedens sp.]HOL20733.1 site-2 protease family protein [Candidatus Hydrogenedens sp.]HPP59153.1 site-2 protease family protein [Candidatus Hydrogenedens sp.]
MIFSIVVFVIVLSILVFVHELGHFISAKLCNVYVDQFSIGMPPRVIGVKIGETDYCIGALPIGGYVKMAGQEDVPLDEKEREETYGHVPQERWFKFRPLWQRYIIIVSGPLMNFVLAIFIYIILVSKGTLVPEMEVDSKIGKVEEKSPAQSAPLYIYDEHKNEKKDYPETPDTIGWQTGDRILSINGTKVHKFSDLFVNATLGGSSEEHKVILERTELDGSIKKYISFVKPQVIEGSELPRYGVAPFSSALIKEVIKDMPAEKAGLKEGDIILSANGKWVDRTTFVEFTEKTQKDEPITLMINRNEEKQTIQVYPTTVGRLRGMTLTETGLKDKQKGLLVVDIEPEIQEKTGLRRKDIITKINGEEFTLERLYKYEREHPGEEIEVDVYRPPVLMGLLEKSATLKLKVTLDSVQAIGVALGERQIKVKYPPHQWLTEALKKSYSDLRQTVLVLKGLIMGAVSPKVLGGPIMIFDATSKAASMGIDWLLGLMALVSVNLAVVNLLPIPILDGSLVFILTVEALRKKPLSPKFQERFQQVGLVIILLLLILVSWNDIRRILIDIIP